ncbi:MAG: hypothetical protein Q8J64_03205 [Thermodesulfovibrionales bacterium]|nr:hypothetical protein [Thermodesulfovibrionales bacterium]
MLAVKKVKDLTTDELKSLIRKTVSSVIDPEALRESLEIASDRELVKKIRSSQKAYREGASGRFVSLKEVKKRHGV